MRFRYFSKENFLPGFIFEGNLFVAVSFWKISDDTRFIYVT